MTSSQKEQHDFLFRDLICSLCRPYVCKLVCVCMYVHMHVRTHACTYTCMYVHMHVRTHACTYTCMYVHMHVDLIRFNKIAIQGKGPDGKWTRKSLAYRESNIFNLCVIRLPGICVNLVLDVFTLLVVTQSVDNLFHSLIVLCMYAYLETYILGLDSVYIQAHFIFQFTGVYCLELA